MHKFAILVMFFFFITLSFVSSADAQADAKVVAASEVNWGHLNPLRGNKSPAAANLWGDRTKNVATGMLVKFNKGFSSPPHIHNISYRGIVINGKMHNDDPNAEKMWLLPGSFWTQPGGENHITAAAGEQNLIYLEIDSGPYLVKASEHAFDNGEQPINLAADNMVWLDSNSGELASSYLWGSSRAGQLGGALVKLPKGYHGNLTSDGAELKVVVISGQLTYQSVEQPTRALGAGSFFSSVNTFIHRLNAESETILYIRSDNNYRFSRNR